MRDVRAQLRSASHDLRVLNLFSYTGSLGLAALHGGAKEVVQVDISQKVLTVARQNEALNQRSGLGVVKYIKEDAGEYLARSARRRKREGAGFDLIIIDPPSFARAKRGVFALERELENLLVNALYSLNKSGQIIFSCNLTSLDTATIQALAHEIMYREGFAASSIQQLLLPVDFTAPERVSTAMRGVWIRII
jgi:23S rRNA (cytosine1962-C5)-methyltransferase